MTLNPNPGGTNPFISPAQSALNGFLLNQFETEGGLFPYDTREYLASGRLDHRVDANNEISLTYRYGHDLEESPDVQSLTAFSAGSSIHTYDNNLQAAWYRQFSPTAQNEARVQWDYYSFNVIPNEPAQVGLQIPSFINNLGTNIFLPNITILRRYEFADNFTKIRGNHTFKFGGLRDTPRQSHRIAHFFPRPLCVRDRFPGGLHQPTDLANHAPSTRCKSASFGLPEVYQQGFGNPTYPYYDAAADRVLRAGFLEDSAKFHFELRPALGTGHTIRPFDHIQEGFCPPGFLRVGSLQGSQDSDPRRDTESSTDPWTLRFPTST